MLRHVIVVGLSTCLLGLTFCFSQTANAQTAYCWINAQTGAPAPLGPPGWLPNGASPSDLTGGRIDMPDANHVVNNITGTTYVRVPCPPTDASTTPPIQSGIVPGGGLLPGKDKDGHDTPDKPGGDAKTTDTKTPVKNDKAQKANTAKTGQTDKSVTGKNDKATKTTEEKQTSKGTKKLTGPKTPTAHKTARSTASKSKEKKSKEKTEVHIEFYSTKSGGSAFGTGFGR